MHESRADFYLRWGPVYWNGLLYRAAMSLLRGGRHADMYRAVAGEIGAASTLDLCCGDGELKRWLGPAPYQGIDKNPAFAAAMRRRGIAVVCGGVLEVPWPQADCVVMVDSLYHFLPDAGAVVRKALALPFRKIIISEPVANLASDGRRWVAAAAAWATRIDGQSQPQRFTEDSLRALFKEYGFQRVSRTEYNLIGVLEK